MNTDCTCPVCEYTLGKLQANTCQIETLTLANALCPEFKHQTYLRLVWVPAQCEFPDRSRVNAVHKLLKDTLFKDTL